jgi:hypothetical protein
LPSLYNYLCTALKTTSSISKYLSLFSLFFTKK